MTRRELLAALAALPVVGLLLNTETALTARSKPCYGFVDVARWLSIPGHESKRVLLDGKDITYGCRWFDDELGEACVLKLDADGKPYIDPDTFDEPASEVLRGTIEVV